jgi:tetratricopeptide (TPR) repeat protein
MFGAPRPPIRVVRHFGNAASRRRFEPRSEWQQIAERALRLESARDFRGALDLYHDVKLDGAHDHALYLAIARCNLAVGAGGIAVDYATRALAIDASDVFALALRTRGNLLAHRLPEALSAADAWIATHPRDAEAYHARGRALFALGQFNEARTAFDRACVLAPDLVEAQLLRREADRAMRRVRDSVGVQPPLELTLPDHLAHLRDAVAAGRIGDVIAELARPEHDNDPIAKLAHARCLAFERRFDEALAALDHVAQLSPEHTHDALLEKAHVLLALDRAAEALALFEGRPDEVEAIEGRALALRRLGRDHEADEQLARALAVASNHSR